MKLYRLYAKAMFNVSLRIVNDVALAEDVMQDSFIEAFDKIGSFRGEGTFGSWLKKIVVNRSINALRQLQPMVNIEDLGIDPGDDRYLKEDHSENLFYRLEEIRTAMEKLPDAYRIILSLHLLEGYDHEEIAGILDTSYGNVRTRYSRAKKKLLHIIMQTREIKRKRKE
jgi:RNA polymerase sigma-70 factor (ECF subfamily)